MHKDEASRLFAALADENSVKLAKMLNNRGDMNYDALLNVVGCNIMAFNRSLESMLNSKLVLLNNDIYSINKELLDTLLKFIVTPCSCTHK